MICTKCLNVVRMMKSATPGKKKNGSKTTEFLDEGLTVFGWWSRDFEIRERQCKKCGAKFKTIEVSIADLHNAFDDIEDNKPLGRPWKPKDRSEIPLLDESEQPTSDDDGRTQSNLNS